MAGENDVVLIYFEGKPTVFANAAATFSENETFLTKRASGENNI